MKTPKKITERGYKIMKTKYKTAKHFEEYYYKKYSKALDEIKALNECIKALEALNSHYEKRDKKETEDLLKKSGEILNKPLQDKNYFNSFSDLERPSIVETINRTSRRLSIKRIEEIAFDGATHEFRSIAFRRALDVAWKIVNDRNIDSDQLFIYVDQKENRDRFAFYVEEEQVDPKPYMVTEMFWPFELEKNKP